MEALHNKLENLFADDLIKNKKKEIIDFTYHYKFRVGDKSGVLDQKFKGQVGVKSSIVESRIKAEIVDSILKEISGSNDMESAIAKFLTDNYQNLKSNAQDKGSVKGLIDKFLSNQKIVNPIAAEYVTYAINKGHEEMSKIDADQQKLLNHGDALYKQIRDFRLKEKFGTTDIEKIRDKFREAARFNRDDIKVSDTEAANSLREINPSREDLESNIFKILAQHIGVENEAVKSFLKNKISSWSYDPKSGFSLPNSLSCTISSDRRDEITSLICKNSDQIISIFEDDNVAEEFHHQQVADFLNLNASELSCYADTDYVGLNLISSNCFD